MQHLHNIQYGYLLNKYLKCSVWRLAVRYGIYRVSGLEVHKNTCLCFSTKKLNEIYVSSTVYRVTQRYFYARPFTSMWAPDFRQRIIEAVQLITPHTMINTLQGLEYGLDICRATTGGPTLKCTDVHKNIF
jgi:hypothetical protein